MPTRPPPLFVADAPGLDVLNTVATISGSTIEWLRDGPDLLAWLSQAKLVPADIADLSCGGADPRKLDAVAAEARALREWFRTFVNAHRGRAISAAALEPLRPLNDVLERDDSYRAVVGAGASLAWRWRRRWRTPDTLLLPIAEAMAITACEADFRLVKQCEGPGCTMLFLDTTKGHARRWCSMALCGNRAKQAAHRARLRGPVQT